MIFVLFTIFLVFIITFLLFWYKSQRPSPVSPLPLPIRIPSQVVVYTFSDGRQIYRQGSRYYFDTDWDNDTIVATEWNSDSDTNVQSPSTPPLSTPSSSNYGNPDTADPEYY